MISNTEICPACGANDLREFFHISRVPVHCNRLWGNWEEAVNAPTGEIRLGFCQECTHVYNIAFDPTLLEYDLAYENSLFFSPKFRNYAEEISHRLIERYDLKRKNIIEIGSGQGEFLRIICELGANRCVGFDPSYGPSREKIGQGQISFVNDVMSEYHLDYVADLICCRHVLEHLESPAKLLHLVRQLDAPVFFEVPNVFYTLKDLGIWDIIYEHYSYFSPKSLGSIFQNNGFAKKYIEEVFGGQFLIIEAEPNGGGDSCAERLNESEFQGLIDAFADNYLQKVSVWEQTLSQIEESTQKVVLWGAGSKGVTFLNMFSSSELIPFVVDINPRKHGKFIPCSGQRIVPPQLLIEYQPDIIILMNSIYEMEIRQDVESMGIQAKFMVA